MDALRLSTLPFLTTIPAGRVSNAHPPSQPHKKSGHAMRIRFFDLTVIPNAD
ncbi:hypothetical protein BN136_2461 [Cronobacter universalis NCTC 9529]|nr:hypothetical protein BN136_2461 [Cronobacter universalis NCTC 9529]